MFSQDGESRAVTEIGDISTAYSLGANSSTSEFIQAHCSTFARGIPAHVTVRDRNKVRRIGLFGTRLLGAFR